MKDKKYSTEDLMEFGVFIRDNFYTDGSPKYHPYSPVFSSGDLEYVFVTWLTQTKREL